MILKTVLILVLLLSTIASCGSAGLFIVFIEEGLRRDGEGSTRGVITAFCLPLVIAVYLSIPAALMVVFTSDPVRHTIALMLLSLPALLIPLITLLTVLRAGWADITGHPAAYGGRPPTRLATLGWLGLMQGLYLLPPVSAWLVTSYG